MDLLSLGNVLDSLIPITRFNRGEANKVFDEVRTSGCKIVVKNNAPACVLISPEKYRALMDELEDIKLYALAEERMQKNDGIVYTQEELMAEDGITYEDLENIPMEYGVDFE